MQEELVRYLYFFSKGQADEFYSLFAEDISLVNKDLWQPIGLRGKGEVIAFFKDKMDTYAQNEGFKLVADLAIAPKGYAIWAGYSIHCPFTNSTQVTKGFVQYITINDGKISAIEIDADFVVESITRLYFTEAIENSNSLNDYGLDI